jgi:hypothetical protein
MSRIETKLKQAEQQKAHKTADKAPAGAAAPGTPGATKSAAGADKFNSHQARNKFAREEDQRKQVVGQPAHAAASLAPAAQTFRVADLLHEEKGRKV